MNCTVFEVQRDNALAHAVLHYKIQRKVFDEIITVVAQRLTVKCVEKRVTGSVERRINNFSIFKLFIFLPVSNATATMRLSTFAKVVALTTEGSLVDFTVGRSREWHSVVLQLDDSLGCFAGHVMDCVLISEPIGSLDCVVHVPLPVVVLHVAESGVDATLSGDCVRSGGEEFCDDGCFEAFSNEAECCAQTGATWREKVLIQKIRRNNFLNLPAPTTTASYSWSIT